MINNSSFICLRDAFEMSRGSNAGYRSYTTTTYRYMQLKRKLVRAIYFNRIGDGFRGEAWTGLEDAEDGNPRIRLYDSTTVVEAEAREAGGRQI